MERRINYPVIVLIASLFIFASCSSKKKSTETEVKESVKIKIEQVSVQEVEQLYDYTAIVEANIVNNVAPSMPLRIDKIFVEIGDRVSQGQKLAQMDQANLLQLKAQLDNVELNFTRMDELYKAGGVSKADLDGLKTQLDVLRAQYKNLADNTQLLSPISGIITARNYDNGDMYPGSPQIPVVQVQQITPVKLLINVSENQYTKIKQGMPVDVKVDVFADEEFKGKVSLIYPTIDPRTHTFPVEITIPNSNSKIRPGMYARVTVNMGSEEHVVVPDVSIVKQQGSGDRFVYVYKDGKVSYNKVVLGRRMGDRYELLSGVENGDYVAITSLSRLNNGMEVEVVKE